jgi:bacillolysin
MKKILLFALLIIPALFINGQNNSFKTLHKNPAGTIKPSIQFKQINGNNSLKSTLNNKYNVPRTLAFPGFIGKGQPVNKVIRKNNSPVYIEIEKTPLKSASNNNQEESFYAFLEETKSITKISNPKELFKITGIRTDDLGITHIRAIQQYKGINIYGSESILHIDAKKERFTGSFFTTRQDIQTKPGITITAALQKTVNDIRKITVYKELTAKEKKILQYESPSYSLVLYNNGNQEYILTWAIAIRPNFLEEWKYFINAVDGEIIHKFNNTNYDGPMTSTGYDLNNILRTFDTFLENEVYYLYDAAEEGMYNSDTQEGIIVTLNANNTSTSNLDYSYVTSTDNTWDNPSAISAHCNATQTYRYLLSTFGRNSINNQGGNIISFVNVAEDDGGSMENAFWNGQAAFYGNGGNHFKPLAGALDVTAHELGHGVVSNTANLEYYGQSGAINETYADIFGSMVDRDDWLIGEDIVQSTYFPSGALRNMADPHNMGSQGDGYWQPKHMSEMYLGTDDNAGVHINNGIGIYTYYLYATAVSKDKAEQVFYHALTEYLTKTSQFIDFRIAVIQSASDLYGASSQEVTKAAEAFDAVGIYEENPAGESPDYGTNPGQEYLLSYDTNSDDPATLYRSSVTGTDFVALSNTPMKRKVSATDDGSAAVFVSTNSRIKALGLDPADPWEDFLSEDAMWDNVAVSKDGKRVAAISTDIDASIYVFDLFYGRDPQQFILYNPTTSHSNTDAGGVLYADAIEFDITGEYLIYDACNELSSSSFDAINYWDIGFIKVWDNNTNNFGDGSIAKLYGSLPEHVSIGNPVFSKNSPDCIAFDYLDEYYQEYGILAANLSTGDVNLIFANTTLGFPTYSNDDSKIAFAALSTGDVEVVATIDLASDRITPNGDAELLINYATWPVYYATGSRTLGLAPVSNFTVDYKSGSAPLHVKYVDLSTNDPTSWQWTFEGGTPSSSTEKNPEVDYTTAGTYKVSLIASNSYGSNTNTKESYIVVSNPTGIYDPENKPVVFYPNPVSDILNITCDRDFSVSIFNLQGELLERWENKHQLDLSTMKDGIYILEVKTDNGLYRHKLMKQ